MISFECDYNNGAHPKVLEALVRTNDEQTLTYGFDAYSLRAKEKIGRACGLPGAQVHLLTGGTQTNLTVIDSLLRSYEAVIATETGHISVHEAGAVEACGHKVITLPHHEGKMEAAELDEYMNLLEADESTEHLAQPGLVYLSFPTELGTVYTRDELYNIYKVCARHHLQLFIDGARLGYGLAASALLPGQPVTLPWLCRHCDALYIGGTKVGALCGEAVVFTHDNAPRRFFSIAKRRGAVLAKGRLTGVQFDALFSPADGTDGGETLYDRISRHAIDMAARLRDLLGKKGCQFWLQSPTNQQFVVLDGEQVGRLGRHVLFTRWAPLPGDRMVCRFVTSWATTEADLQTLRALL